MTDTVKYWLGTIGHCLLTLVMLPIGFLPVGFFLGREIAQAEYRYIQAHGGKRYNCPWYCGLIPSAWTIKGLLDWILPLVIVIIYNVWSIL